jgi:hypothetical protein
MPNNDESQIPFPFHDASPTQSSTAPFTSPFSRWSSFCEVEPTYFTHQFNVEQCHETFFTKFPHPSTPEVIRTNIIEDKIDPRTGDRYRKRQIIIKNTVPWIFRKVNTQI